MHSVIKKPNTITTFLTNMMTSSKKKRHQPKELNDTFRKDRRQTPSNTGHIWSRQLFFGDIPKTKLELHSECALKIQVKNIYIFRDIFENKTYVIVNHVEGEATTKSP